MLLYITFCGEPNLRWSWKFLLSFNCRAVVLLLLRKVNVGKCLWSLANIESANNDDWINFILKGPRLCTIFCLIALIHYVWIRNNTFLLVSSSVQSKQLLCFVHSRGHKRRQKPKTKEFVRFHNHSPLLTMFLGNLTLCCYLLFTQIFIRSAYSPSALASKFIDICTKVVFVYSCYPFSVPVCCLGVM